MRESTRACSDDLLVHAQLCSSSKLMCPSVATGGPDNEGKGDDP